jgi:hypothetical protein
MVDRQFARLSLAEVTADRISAARDALAQETFTHGGPHENAASKRYQRSGATINRYIAALSHTLSFAVKDHRLLDKNVLTQIAPSACG